MFKIENGRKDFFQWDLNQRLIVEDASINEVHFCNKTDDCSLVVEVKDGLVNVPNILLQDCWRIKVYAFCVDHTKVEEHFDVIKRSRPADYVYTETDTITLVRIEEIVGEINSNLEGYTTAYIQEHREDFIGPQGIQGVQGEKGEKGNTGAQGPKGDTGAKGDKGDKGEKGDKGDTGPKGDTGEKGADGTVSFDELTEEQRASLKGEKGDIGPQGLKGDKGDTGAQGVKGDTGAQGIQGPKGDKGDTGAAFTYDMFSEAQLAALTGPQGQKGETGAQGIQGEKGEKGDTGAQGEAGPKGDKGDQGAKGDKGDTGPQGEPGADYILTDNDKSEIANLVFALIPSSEEVNY